MGDVTVSYEYILLARHGVEQAHRNAAALRRHTVDVMFTSPLGRGLATAQIYADRLGTTCG